MRARRSAGGFSVRAIAGTRVVLLAMDGARERTAGLLGFAISRRADRPGAPLQWLPTMKVFRSVVPEPLPSLKGQRPRYLTRDHPVQGFLWSDYDADPDTAYVYTVVPMFGAPGALRRGTPIRVPIRTESEVAGRHRIWFNRGAIASQAFAREFPGAAPTTAQLEDVDDPMTVWLSRGLLEACLAYVRDIPAGDGLRVAAYEFTYRPVLDELRRALDRGVDVRLVVADTREAESQPNETAMRRSRLPMTWHGRRIVHRRLPEGGGIPHNKFMVHLHAGAPVRVWTGSTNFTPSGFLGQSNVGHLVDDPAVAATYLEQWTALAGNPDRATARASTARLTPDPPPVVPAGSTVVLSPRSSSKLLRYYGERIQDAVGSAFLTAAFGVTDSLAELLTAPGDTLRFLLLEKPASKKLQAMLDTEPDVVAAFGVPLGEMYRFKDGVAVARRRIEGFELDRWFLAEEHFRRANDGFVFFVHTKYLLIDPLSDDPLVITGSANFSPNSLLNNDENMLLIRGDTRVADIYLTEFDRLFRHFYARDIINDLVANRHRATKPFLREDDGWVEPYFHDGWFRSRRREMFFASGPGTWAANAAAR